MNWCCVLWLIQSIVNAR